MCKYRSRTEAFTNTEHISYGAWPGTPAVEWHLTGRGALLLPMFQVIQLDWEHVFILFNSYFLLQKCKRKPLWYHFVYSHLCYLIDWHSTTLFSVGLQFLYPGLISPGPPPGMHFPCQILFMSLSSGHAKCISPSCTSSRLFLRTAIYLGMALGLLCPWHSVPRC